MKARDIEKRLEDILPLFTDRFTREIGISSIVPAGTVATVTTSSAHGLSIGKTVIIAGAMAPVTISSLTRLETVATVVTGTDHDLTENFFTEVLLSGFNESEFNGTFKLLSVPNRRRFTIEVVDSGALSGSGSALLEDPGSAFGFNGRVTVTGVTDTVTFTYDLPEALTENATGNNLRIIRGTRIYSAINLERAIDVYEKKDVNNLEDGELTAFVILGPVDASRDRNTLNDGVSSSTNSGSSRQQILLSSSVLVLQKVSNQLSAATARDNMQDIARHIIRALVGFSPGSGFAVESGNVIKFLSHDIFRYTKATYSHLFEFELLADINTEDLQIEPFSVAFRDISATITNDQGEQELTANINLDDDPL